MQLVLDIYQIPLPFMLKVSSFSLGIRRYCWETQASGSSEHRTPYLRSGSEGQINVGDIAIA